MSIYPFWPAVGALTGFLWVESLALADPIGPISSLPTLNFKAIYIYIYRVLLTGAAQQPLMC